MNRPGGVARGISNLVVSSPLRGLLGGYLKPGADESEM
jgi:hypothetical protein